VGRSLLWSRVSVACATTLAALVVGPEVAGTNASSACRANVIVGVLPTWARAGFREPNPRMPYALGDAGRIAGILFGNPLTSPPRKGRNNKILWVSRVPAMTRSDLQIRAQRMTGSRPVGLPVKRIVDGGPGPSIIDLPFAGCWRLSLRWSGQADTIDLRYIAGG
jgi:hypothetical protein